MVGGAQRAGRAICTERQIAGRPFHVSFSVRLLLRGAYCIRVCYTSNADLAATSSEAMIQTETTLRSNFLATCHPKILPKAWRRSLSDTTYLCRRDSQAPTQMVTLHLYIEARYMRSGRRSLSGYIHVKRISITRLPLCHDSLQDIAEPCLPKAVDATVGIT